MSEKHAEEHSTPIKTPAQLIVVVVLAFVVPITLIVMLTQLVTSGVDAGKSHPAMSAEAVAKRLQPVGTVAVEPNQPVLAAAPAGKAAPTVAAGVSSAKGKATFFSSDNQKTQHNDTHNSRGDHKSGICRDYNCD